MSELQIPRDIFEQIVKHAKEDSPIEACGILAGENDRVEKYYKMKNVDNSPEHFMMAPEEQFKVMKDIRVSGFRMLAICHSHPCTPARPSKEDIRLALTPDILYVVISLADTKIPMAKGFFIDEGVVTEVPVKIGENMP